jgi:murein tripeptide amidase MpaA
MKISSQFDGGNIEVLSVGGARSELAIRSDSNADFRQWFAFCVQGGRESTLTIVNAGDATYPDAWDGYRACASTDLVGWSRVPTEFDGQALHITHQPSAPSVYYAYFAPYSLDRHARLLKRARRAPHARADAIASTVDGREVHLVTIGAPGEGKHRIWITARQHPGETQAQWFAEGMLERLLTLGDPLAQTLLERAVFYVVPNMNPDGSVRGNLRANAAGMNLNRAWLAPDRETSPEVLGVREAMLATGVDLFLDIHADERNPYCFLAGCEGNPSYSERIRALENLFEQSLVAFDDDFQDEYGYDRDEPGGGDLSTAGNYVGETFDCLSFTVEMPFKDAENHPDPERGWTPERAKRLGQAALQSVLVCLDDLR